MQRVPVWDIFVRITHWTVAALVLADLTVLDEDWPAHRWAGYVVLVLVGLRLVWGLIGTRYARFSAFPPSVEAARAHLAGLLRGQKTVHLSHNPLGALMIYNFWAALIAVCLTGMLLTMGSFWGIGLVKGLHELIANWIAISIILHLVGVFVETWHSKVNLVRAMITGEKEIPGPGD